MDASAPPPPVATAPLRIGRPVPDFSLPATGDTTFRLSAARGHPLVLYFYPRDNTPGCTTEGSDFRDQHSAFVALDTAVWGISRDSIKTHEAFKAKLQLPFGLISDADELACTLFGVMKTKKLYGKTVRGIERSTFLIDRDGRLVQEWRGVKVAGHVAAVLAAVQTLNPGSAS